ncbi:DUF6197 family protein [Rhodococcus sp. NPDC003994]
MTTTTPPLTPATNAADALTAAAEVIEQQGHAKGVFFSKDGCYCALGALDLVANPHREGDDLHAEEHIDERPEDYPIYVEARGALAETIRANSTRTLSTSPFVVVTEWNDDVLTTADDVVAAMRTAAENLR